MLFTIGKYDIDLNARACRSWFKRPRCERIPRDGYLHFVWGRFSLHIEDWTAETYALCAECVSDEIGEQHCGDEGWTVCRNCRSVEQGYKYVNKRVYEAGL